MAVTPPYGSGLFIEAVGGNAAAANLADIEAKSGQDQALRSMPRLAGIPICADVRGSDANNAGVFIELDAILAVVMGGASLSGDESISAGP